MSPSLKLAGIGLGVVVGLGLIAVLIGWRLPVRHRATREATFPLSPEGLYAIVTDVEQAPAWRRKLDSVEIVARGDGVRSFREIGSDGTILFVVEEALPARRFVTRIADESLPFGGTWTFDFAPSGTGTVLRITEDGEVYNPLFRFVSRFLIGHHATLDRYLADLAAKVSAGPQG